MLSPQRLQLSGLLVFAPAFLQIRQLLHQPVELLLHILSQFPSLWFPTGSHPLFTKLDFQSVKSAKTPLNDRQMRPNLIYSTVNEIPHPGTPYPRIFVFVELGSLLLSKILKAIRNRSLITYKVYSWPINPNLNLNQLWRLSNSQNNYWSAQECRRWLSLLPSSRNINTPLNETHTM